MQEKIDFFKSNSGMNSIDYNAVSGQLTILNGKPQILCQRDDPKFNLFKEFGVIEEDVQASLDAGMNAHLSKPIVIDEVIKTILRYVHN